MTACVNNEKKMKGGALSGKVARTFLAGALAATMVPSVAFADVEQSGEASVLSAQEGTNDFANGTFGWSAKKNDEGKYVVTAGDAFYLTSVENVFGEAFSVSDVTVVYATASDYASLTGKSVSTKPYDTKGAYYAIVINKAIDLDALDADGDGVVEWNNLSAGTAGEDYFAQEYSVVSKSLEGSYFYEGINTADKDFKYTGAAKDVHLADAEGNPIASDQYTVKSGKISETEAGTHTVVIEGAAGTVYDGSLATVKYTIDPIDLANDTLTVDVVEVGTHVASGKLNDNSLIYVNGEKLDATADIVAECVSCLYMSNGELVASGDPSSVTGNTEGLYTFDVKADTVSGSSSNFVNADATGSVEMTVVKQLADVYYGTTLVDGTNWPDAAGSYKTFVTSKGEKFDADAFTAWNGSSAASANQVKCTVSVTKDGQAVTDCTEPGTYAVTVEVKVPSDFAYGAKVTKYFNVVANQFAGQPTVYWQLPSETQTEEYTGEAIVPQIVVKADGAELAAGTDYKVSYEDKSGNAVEAPVEPGKYTVTVDFLGSYYKTGLTGANIACGKVEFSYDITKATIESAKADKEVYEMTGEAVKPTFTAWTEDDLTGLSVAIDPDKTPVTYYEAELTAGVDKILGTDDDEWQAKGSPIKASKLTEEGFYIAKVTAPVDDAHFQGTVESEVFEIREYAKFEDVSAGAWYADSVYKAAELGYMTGVAGTKLFMPEAGIDREQVACVLFNMAGKSSQGGIYFPTAFSDVDGWAWYAEAVSWASQAGVMNGYAGTDRFGVSEKTTREQVAAIFYNYAKSQGKDVSVKDVEGTLAKYADGSQVSPWMREAVAWAVENGVMGNGELLSPLEDVTRAQMAAMAVNYQPEKLK